MVPQVLQDSGVIAVLGVTPIVVYERIVRYEFSSYSAVYDRLNELREQGLRASYLDQTEAAKSLGVHRSTIIRACRLLERLGWIEQVRTKGNRRLYIFGRKSEHSFFAEGKISDILAALPKRTAIEKKIAALSAELRSVVAL